MFRRFRSSEAERAVIERLRAEARQTRPVFSETLHRRLRESVLGLLAAHPPARAPFAPVRPAVLAWAAMAVASILVCGWLAWYGLSPANSGLQPDFQARAPRGVAGLAALPESAHRGAEEVDRLAGAIIAWPTWAGLDEDAQLAARAVAQCFPLRTSRLHDPLKASPVE